MCVHGLESSAYECSGQAAVLGPRTWRPSKAAASGVESAYSASVTEFGSSAASPHARAEAGAAGSPDSAENPDRGGQRQEGGAEGDAGETRNDEPDPAGDR